MFGLITKLKLFMKIKDLGLVHYQKESMSPKDESFYLIRTKAVILNWFKDF